jgi:amino-acid N-acetyltransferase
MRNHPGHAIEMESEAESASPHLAVRPAQLSDVPALLRLINGYASQAMMLPRTELELCESLRDFLVATDCDELVGCGALHFYTPHMAELRSLAVAPSKTRSGVGQTVAAALLEQARGFGVDVVFVFTYVPRFFEKLGFRLVDRNALPLKTWKDCLRCPMFHACDEIAMAYMVTPGAEIYMGALPPDEAPSTAVPVMPILGTPRVLKDS